MVGARMCVCVCVYLGGGGGRTSIAFPLKTQSIKFFPGSIFINWTRQSAVVRSPMNFPLHHPRFSDQLI